VVTRPKRPSSQVVRIGLAELEASFSNGFVSEEHATHRQHFFDVSKAQGEAKVQPTQ
jgi:hypothetical protein